jgi:hypothetical protein
MPRLLKNGGLLALLCAVIPYPAVSLIGGGAVEAYILMAKPPEVVKQNRLLFKADGMDRKSKAYRDAVMGLYGLPVSEPDKVVFVPVSRMFRPYELPEIVLLPVDKQKGENPMQLKTLQFFAPLVTAGAAVTGAVLLGIGSFLGRKKPA